MSTLTSGLNAREWQRLLHFRALILKNWVHLKGSAAHYADYVATNGRWTNLPFQADVVFAFDQPMEEILGSTAKTVASWDFKGGSQRDHLVAQLNGVNGQIYFQGSQFPYNLGKEPTESGSVVALLNAPGEEHCWPSIGISIPTINRRRAIQAANLIQIFYPGQVKIAIVDNKGGEKESLPGIEILPQSQNLGYGVGANTGLHYLSQFDDLKYLGVSNDDVAPDCDCLCELIHLISNLEALGHKPGIIGPVSNAVNGFQQVEIGPYDNMDQLLLRAGKYRKDKLCLVNPALLVKGLFFLCPAEVVAQVGGFDPIFGLGNFEDDDLCVRIRLSGYSLWVAPGAFLHHDGSATFRELKIDYESSIETNMRLFLSKWKVSDFEQGAKLESAPAGISLYSPLSAA